MTQNRGIRYMCNPNWLSVHWCWFSRSACFLYHHSGAWMYYFNLMIHSCSGVANFLKWKFCPNRGVLRLHYSSVLDLSEDMTYKCPHTWLWEVLSIPCNNYAWYGHVGPCIRISKHTNLNLLSFVFLSDRNRLSFKNFLWAVQNNSLTYIVFLWFGINPNCILRTSKQHFWYNWSSHWHVLIQEFSFSTAKQQFYIFE